MQKAKFSEKPARLIDLIDSVLFTHHPTWDDHHQVLITTEEREQILAEACKLVPGPEGRPTNNAHLINAGFPFMQPYRDFNTEEGREGLKIYCQTPMEVSWLP